MTNEPVTLKLTRSQAVVLFEWLARLDETRPSVYGNPAEEKTVWIVEAQLESILTEPFADNYPELLDKARREVMEA